MKINSYYGLFAGILMVILAACSTDKTQKQDEKALEERIERQMETNPNAVGGEQPEQVLGLTVGDTFAFFKKSNRPNDAARLLYSLKERDRTEFSRLLITADDETIISYLYNCGFVKGGKGARMVYQPENLTNHTFDEMAFIYRTVAKYAENDRTYTLMLVKLKTGGAALDSEFDRMRFINEVLCADETGFLDISRTLSSFLVDNRYNPTYQTGMNSVLEQAKSKWIMEFLFKIRFYTEEKGTLTTYPETVKHLPKASIDEMIEKLSKGGVFGKKERKLKTALESVQQ